MRFLIGLAVLGASLGSVACGGGEEPIPERMDSRFTMAADSLPFANFAHGYDASALDADLMQRMFGKGVCAHGASGCTLKVPARAFMNRANEAMAGGRCEGFAVLSSLFESGAMATKEFGAKETRALEIEGNEPLQRELAYWFATQMVPEVVAAQTKPYMAKDALRPLSDALSPDADERYRIGIVRKQGKVVTGGHTLTPIGYYPDPNQDGLTWVRVYDSNDPDNERLLKLDRANNRWEYDAAADPKHGHRVYFGDETNQNPLYFAPVLSRQGKMACSFCEGDAGEGADALVVSSGGAQVSVDMPGGASGWVDGNLELGEDAFGSPGFSAQLDDEPLFSVLGARVGVASKPVQINVTAPADAENVALQGVDLATSSGRVRASDLKVTGKDRLVSKSKGTSTSYVNDSRTSMTLTSEVPLADGVSSLAVSAIVIGGSSKVGVDVDPKTGKVAVSATDSKGAEVTLAVTYTDAKGKEKSGQLTFTSKGDASVAAETDGWVEGKGPLTGTVDNDGETITLTNACTDGKKSGGETDVDCGEVCETKCRQLEACDTGADCESKLCHTKDKICVIDACTDGTQSGDETGIDCGGSCAPCSKGSACKSDADCASGACVKAACVPTFLVNVTIAGLPPAAEVTLQNNGADDLLVSANGDQAFATRVTGAYDVTISEEPGTAACKVTNGKGTATADVDDVKVDCVPTHALGGTLDGLAAGETVTIRNGTESLKLSGDGTFWFENRVADDYAVTVETQPSSQVCTVTKGTGTAVADVVDVTVSCTTGPSEFPIGGDVTGLPSGDSMTLQDNGGDDLAVSGNGPFTFATPVAGPYAVTVSQQPATADCTVTNGTGDATAAVNDVQVDCTATFEIGGTLSGLGPSESVTLQNGAELLPLSGDGAFAFVGRVTGAYAVTVQTQPLSQFCTVTNDSGTAAADVSDVTVDCVDVFPIGGTVTGLPGGESVTLQNNGGDDVVVSIDGPFGFLTPTSDYDVTVSLQPASANCTVTNGTGTAVAPVLDVTVTCGSPGDLDLSFNGTGFLSVQSAIGVDFLLDGIVDPDGSMLFSGQTEVSGSDNDWVLLKVTSAGVVDGTWGTGGTLTVSNGVAYEDARGIFPTGTGAYVVVGTLAGASTPDFGIARVTPTGLLDPLFGTAGLTTHDSGSSWEYVSRAVKDALGRYVVVGRKSAAGSPPHDVVVARLDTDGTLDSTFGTGGWVTYDGGGDEQGQGVAIDAATGDIVVAGMSGADTLLLRYDSTGTLVPTFGTGGVVTTDLSGATQPEIIYAAQADGTGFLVAGRVDNGVDADFVVARFTSTGGLDGTFGVGGIRAIDRGGVDVLYSLIPAPGGGWYIGGHTGNSMSVGKLAANGAVDTAWGAGGYFESPLASSSLVYSLTIDLQSRIVASGAIRTPTEDLGIARILP